MIWKSVAFGDRGAKQHLLARPASAANDTSNQPMQLPPPKPASIVVV